MDVALTLHVLRRLEAERKLRSMPEDLLNAGWIPEAQIEAVIDAVLTVTYAGHAQQCIRARHAGEWCARIARELSNGPATEKARRAGVLAEISTDILRATPKFEHIAEVMNGCRPLIEVAAEIELHLGKGYSPRKALSRLPYRKDGHRDARAALRGL